MDLNLHQHFEVNTQNFKRSLDRIADKYSKLKDDDDVPELDISTISTKSLTSHLEKSRRRMIELGLMSQSDIEDQDLSSDVSDHLQSEDDDSSASSSESSKDDSEKTQGSLDESGLSESHLLPEDRDEALQMSLMSSQSGSLAELYPMMVSRIQRAWDRQAVSTGASLVLRRYRRWRRQPRGSLNQTFNITPSAHHPKRPTAKGPLKDGSGSPGRRMCPETTPRPAPWTLGIVHSGEQQSPGRERASLSGRSPRLISAPHLSGAAKAKERSLNRTFFVGELSPVKEIQKIREQFPMVAASPSRRPHASAQCCVDPPLSFKRHSVCRHSAAASPCAAETASWPQMSHISSSPLRISPLKARKVSALCGPPLAPSLSPRQHDGASSREPTKPRSRPVFTWSPPQRPVGPLRTLHPQDSSQASRPLPLSPPQARPAHYQRGPRRNLSLESSPPGPVFFSPKKVDEDFEKLYQKFVCQSAAVKLGALPALCGRSPEARRPVLPASLSALALSPHRSILRKRHREEGCDGCPQSKLLRNDSCPYSPGSTRHRREMLKRCRCQCQPEPPHSVGPCSPRRLRTMAALLNRRRLHFSSSGVAPENEAFHFCPSW